MTLPLRLEVARRLQAKLAPVRRGVDADWLARNAEYARELQQFCRQQGGPGMDHCIELLEALVDTIQLSELPNGWRGPMPGWRPPSIHSTALRSASRPPWTK